MPSGFHVTAPDPKIHGEELVDLVCKIFGNYAERHAAATAWILGPGFYSLPHTRIGICDGKIVTHWGVFDYHMRVGSALLHTAGVGSVGTHPDYRKRGFMERTAADCLTALRINGFDFSMLFGIQNFYEKFGYTRAWSEHEYIAALSDLPEPADPKSLTEFPFERRPDLEKLFNRYHATHTGAAVRPTYDTWNLRRKNLPGFLWHDQSRRPAGYIALEDKGARLDVIEAVGDSEMILRAVALAARKFACDDIHFLFLPGNGPLATRLRRGNIGERIQHFRNGMAVARIIHLPRTLEKLAGELSQRLRRAGLGDYRGKLAIHDGNEWATLAINKGRIHITPAREATPHTLRAGREMSQLILGTHDPDETIHAASMRLTADAPLLTRALFPNQYPTLAAADRF